MNLLIVGRRVAVVSSVVAALLAAGYAASEHHTAQSLQAQLRMTQEENNTLSQQYDRTEDSNDAGVSSTEDASSCSSDYAAVDDDTLPKVRQAARDFLQETKPGAKTEGVFTLALRPGNLYIAGVDASDGGQRRTIDLLVRLYTKRNGGQYWRAESLGPDRAAALMDKVGEETAPAGSAYDADDASSDNSNGQ